MSYKNNLEGVLPKLLRDKGWEIKFDQHRVFADWKDLVDETTAAHCRPLKVVKNVLWLEVENSSWMQQLQYQKIGLLEAMNHHLRISFFSDIRFSVEEKQAKKPEEEKTKLRFVPPPAEKAEQFRKQISIIEDEKIRESLMRLWYLAHACRNEDG